jgi:transposase-like protein
MSHLTDNLSPQQSKAIMALLTASSIAQAADEVGVTPKTLFKWLADPTFDAAYKAAKREAVGQAIARLQQLSGAAVMVLAQIMVDKGKPASSRVAAASKILDTALKVVELEEIEARLSALETSIKS